MSKEEFEDSAQRMVDFKLQAFDGWKDFNYKLYSENLKKADELLSLIQPFFSEFGMVHFNPWSRYGDYPASRFANEIFLGQ